MIFWSRNISTSLEQELSGSEKATLGDLINHNMQLAHDLYQVRQKHIFSVTPVSSMMLMAKVGDETILETALVSLLPDFEVEVGAN